MNLLKKSTIIASIALGAAALVSPVFASELIISGNGTGNTNSVGNNGGDVTVNTGITNVGNSNTATIISGSGCIPTDVKGDFTYTGNHLSGNPVTGLFDNIATNENCSDDVYVHIFGSNQEPETDGWLESQSHVATQTHTIPQGQIGYQVSVTLPESDYCWYQVDATRTSEVKTPPTYNGTDMISYVFVKNKECDEVTPTPTASPSATPTPTPGDNGGGSSNNDSGKTVESIQASLGTSVMAPTGFITNIIMGLMVATGAVLTLLGALSLRKEKSE